MGDLIGEAISGKLVFLPQREFQRVLGISERIERAFLFADCCRLNALSMIAQAGSGHIGSTFSSLDIVSWLLLEELDDGGPGKAKDLYFSSKGHDVPGLYAALTGLGRLPFESLHRLRRLGGLPGHPDVGTPGVVANTGSLGMGISKAKGMVFGRRHTGAGGRVFVLTGDGELQEGQIWESLVSAVNFGLAEITVIVDHNKLQSDTLVKQTSDLGDLVAKFEAFGWHVERVDGHDLSALSAAIARCRGITDRPQVIIADTIKGRGVSVMEHTTLDSDTALYRFHSGAPDADTYGVAVDELCSRIQERAARLALGRLELEHHERPTVVAPNAAFERLIPRYTEALLKHTARRPELFVLDADLALDTGVLQVRDRFPERFVECGIAEMDMVSTAGGMAREGLLPVCHSFACFLSTRANEQIFNNATERSKVVYVMSLAGVLPGGPGHSHQSVRDISVLASVPHLTLVAPSCAAEVEPAVDWAIDVSRESTVIRLESVPVNVPFRLPANHSLREGVGTTLRDGNEGVMIGYGPVMLAEAFRACELLAAEGISLKLVALPWLNRVDRAWLTELLKGQTNVFCIDNHLVFGGQGQFLAAEIARLVQPPPRVETIGVEGIPACGGNAEVLRHHALDASGLVERVQSVVGSAKISKNHKAP
jgi:transketolase